MTIALFNGVIHDQQERIEIVARLLGYKPDEPDSWDRNRIKEILAECEKLATERLLLHVRYNEK